MEDIFGSAGKALQLCENRATILTNNIANASTPHYLAKDIDFHKLLTQETLPNSNLQLTNSKHLSMADPIDSSDLMYRVPMQNSLDGNTVNEQMERKNFIENALHYQVNLTFIQNKTDEIKKAIKGE